LSLKDPQAFIGEFGHDVEVLVRQFRYQWVFRLDLYVSSRRVNVVPRHRIWGQTVINCSTLLFSIDNPKLPSLPSNKFSGGTLLSRLFSSDWTTNGAIHGFLNRSVIAHVMDGGMADYKNRGLRRVLLGGGRAGMVLGYWVGMRAKLRRCERRA